MSSTFSRRSLARYATSTGLPRGPHCEASLIALEYAVHGQAVQTGRTYNNHFVSVITIKDRKVTHWRDYLDPLSVFNAIGWPPPERSAPGGPQLARRPEEPPWARASAPAGVAAPS